MWARVQCRYTSACEWRFFFEKKIKQFRCTTKRFGCRGKFYEFYGFMRKKNSWTSSDVTESYGTVSGVSVCETNVGLGCAPLRSRNRVADDASADRPRGRGWGEGEGTLQMVYKFQCDRYDHLSCMRVRPSSRSHLILPEPTTALHYRRCHIQSSSGYYKSCRHFRLVLYILISYLYYIL